MQRILVCTDGSPFSANSYRYAAWLAPREKAAINVLYVSDIRSQKVASTGDFSGSIGVDASRALLNQLVELEHQKARLNQQRAKLILETATRFFETEAVPNVKTIHETGFLVDSLSKFEAAVDLIILGKRGEAAEFASGHLGANLERILRASRKPCWVTASQYRPIAKVAIAYDGSVTGQKILQFIATSPTFSDLEIHVVSVAKTSTDGEKTRRLLDEAATTLAALNPTCVAPSGNAESAIASYIDNEAIDLLVMGAYGHNRLRHLVIGSTTVQLLRSTTIPVLVYR